MARDSLMGDAVPLALASSGSHCPFPQGENGNGRVGLGEIVSS